MGFLDKLKDIGFGNTGPYGRMDSGATNYARYAQERAEVETERGVAQDLAMAAKEATDNNTEISGKTFIDIATKYKVPLNSVIKRGTRINEHIFGEVTKGKMKAAFAIDAENKKIDPNLVRDEKYIEKVINQVGGMDYRQRDILYRAVVQMVGQKKLFDHDPQKALLSLSGTNVIKTEREPVPGGKTETPEQKTARTLEEYEAKIKLDQKHKGTPDEIAAKKLDDEKALATHKEGLKKPEKSSDLVTGWNEWKKLPGKENITLAEFKTTAWNEKTGELTDNAALEILQDHAYTMDEKLYPKFLEQYKEYTAGGMSRMEAIVKVLKGQPVTREIAQQYLDAHNNDINAAQEAARADGYTF